MPLFLKEDLLSHRHVRALAASLTGLLALFSAAEAQVVKEPNDPLDSLTFVDERLLPKPAPELVEEAESSLDAQTREGWHGFRAGQAGEWKGYVDRRHGQIDYFEGSGMPWIPGRGNGLQKADIARHLGKNPAPTLGTLESIARSFLPRVAHLFGVDHRSLKINYGRSGQPADHLWVVDFDVYQGDLPIEGARVLFRVNNGNLIQAGTENLPPAHARAPHAKVTREEALALVADYIGGFHAWDTFQDGGSLHLLPAELEDERQGEGFAFGRGRGLATVWQFVFTREDVQGTWLARVDAASGEILEFRDDNRYAQVTGGVYLGAPSAGETIQPMPFANLSSGGYANSAGVYSYPGGTVSTTLNGQYVQIVDNCGGISKTADASGNIALGTSAGTNCTTPGFGGAGNTHASRTTYYQMNRAKEIGRGWLPSNSWLAAKVTANVNINNTCNAFWNGSTLNFYRSGSTCANTGEITAIGFHEYGHGLDSNDGTAPSSEMGTGEAYGDVTAAFILHNSCLGPGYKTGNCGGYGDACTACTGIRDIDYARHSSGVAHTVANFTQPRCPTHASYKGPCGREGHCESYVASEALWDLANRDLPGAGTSAAWSVAERLWYLSRSTSGKAFNCSTGTSPWTSNGCSSGTFWRSLRAVDDDDGNLANGTPHGGALYAAFNRHGIACTTDSGASATYRACAVPAVPSLTASPNNNRADLSWTSSGANVSYDVFRSEGGCNSGFARIANDLTATSFSDFGVVNGTTYSYQVVAHRTGNESCGADPTTCQQVVPAVPPVGPVQTSLSCTDLGPEWYCNVYAWDGYPPYTYEWTYTGEGSAVPNGNYVEIFLPHFCNPNNLNTIGVKVTDSAGGVAHNGQEIPCSGV